MINSIQYFAGQIREGQRLPAPIFSPIAESFGRSWAALSLAVAVTMAMHLAIGARTPLVLLNNIFNRYEFELYGRGEITEPSTPCDCYYDGVCRTGRSCINEISPEAVFEAVLRSLKAMDRAEDSEHV